MLHLCIFYHNCKKSRKINSDDPPKQVCISNEMHSSSMLSEIDIGVCPHPPTQLPKQDTKHSCHLRQSPLSFPKSHSPWEHFSWTSRKCNHPGCAFLFLNMFVSLPQFLHVSASLFFWSRRTPCYESAIQMYWTILLMMGIQDISRVFGSFRHIMKKGATYIFAHVILRMYVFIPPA